MADHQEFNEAQLAEVFQQNKAVHSSAEALLKLTLPEFWQILRALTVMNSSIRSSGSDATMSIKAENNELKGTLLEATSQMAAGWDKEKQNLQTLAELLSVKLNKNTDEFAARAIMNIEKASIRSIEGAAGEVRGRTVEMVKSQLETINATYKRMVDEMTYTTWQGLLLWAGKLIGVIVLATAVNQLIGPAFNSLYPRSRALMLEAAEYEYVLTHADSATLQHIDGILETRKGR